MRPEEGLVLGLLQERLALEKNGKLLRKQLQRSLKQMTPRGKFPKDSV
jgi:hypothetical protein